MPPLPLSPGTLVRLIANPGRTGVTTGRSRERADRIYWQVMFPDGSEWALESQIEEIPDTEDPIDQLETGRLGRIIDLRRNLTFIRLNGQLANLIYSMDTTNTDFYPHQFKPVLDFLNSPSNGILIADEVGLGKTIEAGLIWTELRSRFDFRRLMVLCPAMLREKWQFELKNKFGISGEILDAKEALKQFKESISGQRNELSIIASFQGLRPRRGWNEDDSDNNDNASKLARFIDEVAYENPLLDLLIIDEAHYLRNPESMTSKLGRLLRQVAENITLLSATPIQLRSRDLYQLLNLVDQSTFNEPTSFDEILQANRPLIMARDMVLRGWVSNEAEGRQQISQQDLLSTLRDAQSHSLLQDNRQLKHLLENPPTDDELTNNEYRAYLANRLENVNLLGHAVTRTRKRDVVSLRVRRDVIPEEIPLSEPEEKFYEKVTNLVREFSLSHGVHEGFLLVTPQRQMSSCMAASLEQWEKTRKEIISENAYDEQAYEDLGIIKTPSKTFGPLTSMLINEASNMGDLNELTTHDSKFNRLRNILRDYLNRNPNEKIVLFAYFRPTLRYLKKRLNEEGIESITLMGGDANKGEILRNFQDPSGPKVLLSSEVASEGIDLQFSKFLINYDLPWNPMKVEQRIGRIDRLGQDSPNIKIWNLFYQNTIDSRIYTRLYDRLRLFENTLGDLEEVLGDEIQKLTSDLLTHHLTSEQEIERIEQSAQAIANLRNREEVLEGEAGNLIAHGDYILNQVKASRELERCITGEDIWVYIKDFFDENYTGSEFIRVTDGELLFDVRLSEEAKIKFEEFVQSNGMLSQTNLASTHTRAIRCRFANKVAGFTDKTVEVINQFHPLVRFSSHKIKEFGPSYYHKTVGVKLPSSELPGFPIGVYVFFVDLWSLQGVRSIERLNFVVKPYNHGNFILEDKAEQLVTTTARKGIDWIGAENFVDIDSIMSTANDCISKSEEMYNKYVQEIADENNDRADLQEKSIKNHLARSLDSLNNVLQGHRTRGREALVRATEGRITALINRVDRQILRINDGRELKHHKLTSCLGIISLEDFS
jgi:superfamily II DNA or RNA helicase